MRCVGLFRVCLLLAVASTQACSRGAKMIDLNEAAAERSLTTEVGEKLRITLPENRTTGFKWKDSGTCDSILKKESDQFNAPTGPPGAGGERVWVFSVQAKGKCELRFAYERSWEGAATGKALTFPITVQ
jgi:inhibitor of cysteine peptidase